MITPNFGSNNEFDNPQVRRNAMVDNDWTKLKAENEALKAKVAAMREELTAMKNKYENLKRGIRVVLLPPNLRKP